MSAKVIKIISSNIENLIMLPDGTIPRGTVNSFGIPEKGGTFILTGFDVEEFKKYHAITSLPGSIDILDIGYSYVDPRGEHGYEPPDMSWRQEMQELKGQKLALTGTLPDDEERLTPIEELVSEETADKIRKAAAEKQKANEVADSFFHNGLCADKEGYATASLQARAAEKVYREVVREAYREFRATRKREKEKSMAIITRDTEDGRITIDFEPAFPAEVSIAPPSFPVFDKHKDARLVARRDSEEVGNWGGFDLTAFQIWHKKYVKNKDVSGEPLKHIGGIPLYAEDVDKIAEAINRRNLAVKEAKEKAIPGVFALEYLYSKKAQILSAVEGAEDEYPRAKAYLYGTGFDPGAGGGEPGVFALKDLYSKKARILSAVEHSEEEYPRAKAYLYWRRIKREAKETDNGNDEGYAAGCAAEALEEGKSLEEAQTIMENILSERHSAGFI